MKKMILAFFTLLAFQNSRAQITIDQSDFVSIGDILHVVNDSLCTTAPGSAGAGITWNLSTLQNHYIDTSWFLTPTGTPAAASFPNATIAYKTSDIQGGYTYGYYNITPTFVDLLGSTDGVNTIAYDEPIRQLTFPSTYNTSFNRTSIVFHTQYAYPQAPYDSAKINFYLNVASSIDGWGDVTTPAATFGSLRQKFVTYNMDSTFLHDAVNNTWVWDGVAIAPSNADTNYYWLAKNATYYVAGVSVNQPGALSPFTGGYLLSTATAIDHKTLSATCSIYPNPFTTETIIKSEHAFRQASLNVYNILGEKVRELNQLNGTQIILQRNGLPAGIYIIQITENNKMLTTQKLVITE